MLDAEAVDYGYQTQRGIQLYKKWKDEGAVAILGYGTNDTEAMVGFIAEDKMPYFSFSFSGHLTDPSGISAKAKAGKIKPAPYNFFGQPSYSDGNRALVLWAAEDWKKKGGTGKPKYIHLGDNHPYPLAPKEAGEGIAKELGFDVLPSIQYALGGGDFKAQCLALQSSGANYAFLANTTGANVALVRSCSTVGVNVQFMANVWGMDEAGMKAIGKAVDGLVMVLGQPQWGSDVPGMKVFREISAMSDPTGKVYRPLPYATRRLPGAASRRRPEDRRQGRKAQWPWHQGRPRMAQGLRACRRRRHVRASDLDEHGSSRRRHRQHRSGRSDRRYREGRSRRSRCCRHDQARKVAEQKVPRKPEWHGY